LIPHADTADRNAVLGGERQQSRWQLAEGPFAQFPLDIRRHVINPAARPCLFHTPPLLLDPPTLALRERPRLSLRSPTRQRHPDDAVAGDTNNVAAGAGVAHKHKGEVRECGRANVRGCRRAKVRGCKRARCGFEW